MKIGITYNLKEEFSLDALMDSESIEEFDTAHTIDAICSVFRKNGFEAVKLGGSIDVIDNIKSERVDFVFNIAEGYRGRSREGHIPSVLEMLEIPYSGSDPLTLGLTLDKIMTKKIALQAGIPTPHYKVATKTDDLLLIEDLLRYPLMVKPAWEGSSKGIYSSSRVYDKEALGTGAAAILEKYQNQPVLVEEYIKGREITVGLIGNDPPKILGIMEIVNKEKPGEDFFYSLEIKKDWRNLVDYVLPPDMDSALEKHIRQYALSAFKEFGCRDVARMDFRISEQNRIYLLEINPLPGLSPEYADLVIMAQKQGMEYEDLIMTILNSALSRYPDVAAKAEQSRAASLPRQPQ